MATRKLPKGATTRRPSSRGYASNAAKIESLVPPERVPSNNPSTMSGRRDIQSQAFREAKTGVSETYKLDAKGNKIPVSEEEFKKAAQKFVNAERKIPKGTSLSQVKAAKFAGKEKLAELQNAVTKAMNKKLDTLSAAERKMAREGIAPPRAPATPPTAAPAPAKPAAKAAKKVAAAPKAAAPAKMTRAQRSAANKAKHAVVRAAEEKKWAEQKAAKKGAGTKPTAAKPVAAKPAKPAASKPVVAKPAAVKPVKPAAKPVVSKPAATIKPASATTAKPTAAPVAPKAGIMGKIKGAAKNTFSLKGLGVGIGGAVAADAIRGDGKSTARNITSAVVGDTATGYAIGRQYGALAGATVGLVRGAYEEGKRTGRAPLALPKTPRMGGTFGGRKPAAATQTAAGSTGPRTRGGARRSSVVSPATQKPSAVSAAPQRKASSVSKAAPRVGAYKETESSTVNRNRAGLAPIQRMKPEMTVRDIQQTIAPMDNTGLKSRKRDIQIGGIAGRTGGKWHLGKRVGKG